MHVYALVFNLSIYLSICNLVEGLITPELPNALILSGCLLKRAHFLTLCLCMLFSSLTDPTLMPHHYPQQNQY